MNDSLVNLIVGMIASSIPAFLYILKLQADIRRDSATAHNTQQVTSTDAVNSTLGSLILLLKDSIDNMGKANEIASKERTDSALVQREMMGHINGVFSALKLVNEKQQSMNLSLDDVERTVTSARDEIKEVKTDVEGVLVIQFKPIVEAIQLVSKQIGSLSDVLKVADEETIKRMGLVQSAIGALETTLLKILEPIAIAYIGIGEAKNGSVASPATNIPHIESKENPL